MATWICVSCDRRKLHHQGVAMHRAGHRNHQELCVMERTFWQSGRLMIRTSTYDFRPEQEKSNGN